MYELPHVARGTLGLGLRHAHQQHAGGGDQETPRLEPELQVGRAGVHRAQRGVEFRQIERGLFASLRYAEPATNVDDPQVRKISCRFEQQFGSLCPAIHLKNTTAGVRVQADYPAPDRSRK